MWDIKGMITVLRKMLRWRELQQHEAASHSVFYLHPLGGVYPSPQTTPPGGVLNTPPLGGAQCIPKNSYF